jgi:hypothetical protein
MKKHFLYLTLIPLLSITQNYNGPESIEYNAINQTYFISNSGNGQILELDSNENLSIFVNNINTGPHGLELVQEYIGSKWVGQILYACSGGRLYGYDIDGNQVLNYNMNGTFLNGITQKINPNSEQVELFITDFSEKKLYKYSIEENNHYEICSFNKNPNGVFYDSMNNRLLVVCWGGNAPIYEIDLTNNDYSTVITTNLSNLDGISMDQCGNFYISAWSSNAIHKYNSDFSETEIIINGLNNPADICFNQTDNIIGIPNSGNNTVELFNYSCNNSSITNFNKTKSLIKRIDFMGRETTKKGLNIEIYNNGSSKKIFLLN